jgi:hypothetical protein
MDADITVLRPVPPDRADGPPNGMAAAPPRRPLRVALLDNGKPNGAELLDALAVELAAHLDVAEVRRWRKPSVSVPPEPADRAEIERFADVAITAIGD